VTGRERYLLRRCARLDQLCAAGRQTVRRVPPIGYDVTIYRGPLDEPVDLVVEADWSPGCCVSWDCPGDAEGWEVGRAWMKRRGTWRTVQLSKIEVEQVERELGEP
jgi:hypothetical protein